MGIQVDRQASTADLICQRLAEYGNATTGMLIVNALPDMGDLNPGAVCWTLEDRYSRSKIYGETRIPAGLYRMRKRNWGGTFGKYRDRFGHEFVVEICDVPNYSDVLIHIGNTANNTLGCLLVGCHANKSFGQDPDADPTIGHSTKAYLDLYQDVFRPLFASKTDPTILVRDEDYLTR